MLQTLYLRKASPADFDDIVQLEQSCFPKKLAYSRQQLWYLLTRAHSSVVVATQNNHLCGFIILLYKRGTRVAGIETVNVDPAYRGQGIGRQLLSAAEHDARTKKIRILRLEVAATNKAALRLYEQAGFTKSAFLKNYYQYSHQGTRDAIRMVKELSV
ncbi:MAG: GNAT family N-acetyltransferase [Candidatus Thermoplasmatota archaeon]|nr:GNAT family N-acetyltransferase [Candidatus Thermoplasmatota archaeon]